MRQSFKSRLMTIDKRLAKAEKALAGLFCALLLVLIALNVIVRALKIPVYWIDEAAVFAMIWMAFLAASSAIHSGEHIAVSLFLDKMNDKTKQLTARLANFCLLITGIICVVLCWVWFDPVNLIKAGANVSKFSDTTLNFVYMEPTISFKSPKFIFWLIMPIFSLTFTFHALAKFIKEWSDFPVTPAANEGG